MGISERLSGLEFSPSYHSIAPVPLKSEGILLTPSTTIPRQNPQDGTMVHAREMEQENWDTISYATAHSAVTRNTFYTAASGISQQLGQKAGMLCE
jgi:hypothetical protein